jgi:subfamily B ATP-binding cassette protein MsbA
MNLNQQKPSTSAEVFKRLIPFVRAYRGRLFTGILCGMLQGGATFGILLGLYWGLGLISGDSAGLSSMTSPGEVQGSMGDVSMRRVWFTVSVLPLAALIQGLLFFCGKYLVEWVGNQVVADLRSKLFCHIHALPMQFFSQSRVGELISRVTNDTTLLTQLVSNVVGDIIREPFTLIACISAMFYLDWKLSLIALVVFPIVILPVALLGRKVRKASKRGQEGLGDMLSVVQETIGGALVVKAFQMEKQEAARFNKFNQRVFKMVMKQALANSLSEPIMIFFSSLGIAAVVVYAFNHNLKLSLLLTFAAAMVQMYKPSKKLSQLHMRVQKAAPGVERIFEVLDITNTIDDAPDAVDFSGTVQTVDFNQVSFAYDDTPVLSGIDLKTKAGQCIAFVGSSGAGKTSLVNLIPRFFDVTGGSVCINGTDIRRYTVQSLRSLVGIVTQDTVLFNRSVAENIAYGSSDADPQLVEAAARRANAHDFIMGFDKGYDTVIGERGSRLSGGMAQRVTIARALFKNPPILILDEATSALDTESERLVQGALDELMKDRTVFVIAHRLSTIAHADLIVVLDKGRIVEQGTHRELLDAGGKYKFLYDIQFGA